MSVSLLPRVAWRRRSCVQLAWWALFLAVGCTDSSKPQAGAEQASASSPNSAELDHAVAEAGSGFDSDPDATDNPIGNV